MDVDGQTRAQTQHGTAIMAPTSSSSTPRISIHLPTPSTATQYDIRHARKWISFAATLLCMLCGGTLYLFGTYASELKSILGYSQTQVNIVASAGGFGLYLSGPLFGAIVDKLEPKRMVFGAALMLFTGYFGMALSLAGTLPSHVALVALMYTFVGLGSSGCYNAGLKTNMMNFEPKDHGFAVGVSVSMFGLSALVFSALSRWFVVMGDATNTGFVNSDASGGSRLDVVRFLMFMGLCTGALTLVASLALAGTNFGSGCCWANTQRPSLYEPLPSHGRNASSSSTNSSRSTGSDIDEPRPAIDSTRPSNRIAVSRYSPRLLTSTIRNFITTLVTNPILRDPSAWSLFLPFMMLSGLGLMYINNIGSIVISLFPPNPDTRTNIATTTQPIMVSLISLFNCLGRIATGLASDRAQKHRGTPRLAFLVLGGGVVMVAQIIGVLMVPSLPLLATCTCILGFGYGSVFSSTPAIVGKWFGVQRFGSNWGIFQVAPALGGYMWNLAFGLWMDMQKVDSSSGECAGSMCFRGAFALGLIASLLSVVSLARLQTVRSMQQQTYSSLV